MEGSYLLQLAVNRKSGSKFWVRTFLSACYSNYLKQFSLFVLKLLD